MIGKMDAMGKCLSDVLGADPKLSSRISCLPSFRHIKTCPFWAGALFLYNAIRDMQDGGVDDVS